MEGIENDLSYSFHRLPSERKKSLNLGHIKSRRPNEKNQDDRISEISAVKQAVILIRTPAHPLIEYYSPTLPPQSD